MIMRDNNLSPHRENKSNDRHKNENQLKKEEEEERKRTPQTHKFCIAFTGQPT